MNKKIYVFRHAITYFSKNKIPYGTHQNSAEILKEGVFAYEKMAKYLADISKPTAFYTSPLLRCIQTSKIVQDITGISFNENNHITEIIGFDIVELEERIKTFLEIIKSEPGDIWICTHGAVISCILSLLTKNEFNTSDLPNYPASGILCVFDGARVEKINFNELT